MKKIVMSFFFFALNVQANSLSLGVCLDKIVDAAAKEVLNKTIEGNTVARYGVKSVSADLWMAHSTYNVVLIGTQALGAESRFEKEYTFIAQPDDLCQELNLREIR